MIKSSPLSLCSLSTKAFIRQVPPLMSLSRVAAAASLGIACDVSAVLPVRRTVDTSNNLPSVDNLVGTFADMQVGERAECVADQVTVSVVGEKLTRLKIDGSTAVEIQVAPSTPKVNVTIAPDHSPKVPLLQDTV